jgi:hypothetical protein
VKVLFQPNFDYNTFTFKVKNKKLIKEKTMPNVIDPMEMYLLECLHIDYCRVISLIMEVDFRSPTKRSISKALIDKLEGKELGSLITVLKVNNKQRVSQLLSKLKRRLIRERGEELTRIHGNNFLVWQLHHPDMRIPGKYRRGEWSFDLLNKTWTNKKEEKTCNGL